MSRGVVQISAFVDAILASLLPTGALAGLANAQTLYTLPVSLFGMSVAAAELPELSAEAAAGEEAYLRLRARLEAGMAQIAFFIVPSMLAMAALGQVIAGAVFQTGLFSRSDAVYVWGILAGSAVGLLAGTLGRLYASAWYALHDARTPLRFAAIRVGLTIALGYIAALYVPAMDRDSRPLGRGRAHRLGRDRGLAGIHPAAAQPGAPDRTDRIRGGLPDQALGRGAGRHRDGMGGAPPAPRAMGPHCHRHRRPASFRDRLPGRNGAASGAAGPSSGESNLRRMTAAGISETLQRKLEALPTGPGVYLWKDHQGQVLYVGKAANLRSRVRNYFGADFEAAGGPKDRMLRRLIADLDTIVVERESQSLLLENNLIKEYQPRFNVRLKDDKSYPSIAVTLKEPFPRVLVTRRRDIPGARYFGPYTDVGEMRRALALVRRIFTVRSCDDDLPATRRDRPCLDFHIGRCLAPCVGWQEPAAYRAMIDEVVAFLEGHTVDVRTRVREMMREASGREDYERARDLRDTLRWLDEVDRPAAVETIGTGDADVIGYARDGDDAVGVLFRIREGKVTDREHRFLENVEGESDANTLEAFLVRVLCPPEWPGLPGGDSLCALRACPGRGPDAGVDPRSSDPRDGAALARAGGP